MEPTGKQFVEFWGWAAQKKLMNENTAYSFASPVKQVVSIDDNWRNIDVSKMDVEDLLSRFQDAKGTKFTPGSLNAYFRRFRQAHDLFLQYIENPTGWKFKGQQSNATRKARALKAEKGKDTDDAFEMPVPQSGSVPLVDYPFPLRDNCIVRLKLPADLKVTEVERLAAFMRTLTSDFSAS
jgi:hypothetical protein